MIYTEAPEYGEPISAVIDMVFRLTSSISFYEPTEKKICSRLLRKYHFDYNTPWRQPDSQFFSTHFKAEWKMPLGM